MWKHEVRAASKTWCELQRKMRPLRTGLDRKGFGRWGEVGLELGTEGCIGFRYIGK